MLEALIVTLREGIEAALVVGIIAAFLRREQGEPQWSAVGSGIAAALGLSVLCALGLYRLAAHQELVEGILYLVSAAMVGSLLVWMWRRAPTLASDVKGSLGRILVRGSSRATWAGICFFTFVMVLREGVETVFFLSARSLSTSGLLAFLGAAIGLAAAAVFGVLFARGSVRVDLRRFFAVTGVALLIFVVQLLCNGYHELAEGGYLPASARSMAIIGPLVRNEFFFIAAVVILPLVMLLVPGRGGGEATAAGANPAEDRLRRARATRQRRARVVSAGLGLAILAALGLALVYAQESQEQSPASEVSAQDGVVRIPVAQVADGKLHRFRSGAVGKEARFLVIATGEPGQYAAAFDACEICGAQGYREEGAQIVCRHCSSAIYPPSIGQGGGCNPIPLTLRREGADLVVALADLESRASLFR